MKDIELDYGFGLQKEKILKDSPFVYKPYEILEYIEGDSYDYIVYIFERVSIHGNYTDDGLKCYETY